MKLQGNVPWALCLNV